MGYGSANRLTNFNGIPIPYDADGNALKTPLGENWGNLTFDSLNQLTDVNISGSAVSYSYTYDAEGYRIAKTENGIITNFSVDPNAELSRVLMSTTNGETTYYVYGLGLISQEKSNSYRLYHYDYRGSTTALTTLDGNVTDTVYYDPYGKVISRTGTTETPFLYVGKYGVETDADGLHYMRSRYYNPQIQRFINVDPIRDGYNWYGYVNGSPLMYIDPMGLWRKGDELLSPIQQKLIKANDRIRDNLYSYDYSNLDYYLKALCEGRKDDMYVFLNRMDYFRIKNENIRTANVDDFNAVIWEVPLYNQGSNFNACWLYSELTMYVYFNDLDWDNSQIDKMVEAFPESKEKGTPENVSSYKFFNNYEDIKEALKNGPIYAIIGDNGGHAVVVTGVFTYTKDTYILGDATLHNIYTDINRYNCKTQYISYSYMNGKEEVVALDEFLKDGYIKGQTPGFIIPNETNLNKKFDEVRRKLGL